MRVFDLYQVLHPRDAKQRPVVIVDIDEKSLKTIGQWPWPRTRVAELVNKLTQMGAAAIAFDIVFSEPDRMSPGVAAETFAGLDDATRARLRALPSNDQVLADAIKHSRVVLGESGLPFPTPIPKNAVPSAGIATLGPNPRPYLLNYPGLLRNVPVLEQAASRARPVQHPRRARRHRAPRADGDGGAGQHHAVAHPRNAPGGDRLRRHPDPQRRRRHARAWRCPAFRHPDRPQRPALDPFRAARRQAASSRRPTCWPARCRPTASLRRLVLIGTSAVGLLDAKTTPLDPVMPGVEVHAQVLESALGQSVLSEPDYALGAELLAALVLGAAIVWLAPILSPALLLVFGAVIVALTVGASWYFYIHDQLLIDFTYPLLSSLLVYLTLMFANYFSEQAQRRRIRSAFGQYLSPALVEQLAQSPEKLVLGGEERNMTILFSDVRGFTTISELYKHDPQGLTTFDE